MTKFALIYHSADLDGMCSAAIMKKFFNTRLENKNTQTDFIGWNYGEELPILDQYTNIIMADISFPADVMKELHRTKNLIWIDHHKAIIEELEPLKIPGLRDTSLSACELTWKYLFPEADVHPMVELLGKYDTFRHKDTPEEETVNKFQYGAQVKMQTYDEVYEYLEDWAISDFQEFKYMGENVLDYLRKDINQVLKTGLKLEFRYNSDKVKVIAINKPGVNPAVIGINYHNEGYDALINFSISGQNLTLTIYNANKKVDVSKIAKQFGGGGHPGASGFRIPLSDLNNFLNKHKY